MPPATRTNTVEVHNDHNVFILGAGFSAEAGYPVMSTFLSQMQDTSLDRTVALAERDSDAIQHVMQMRLAATAAAYRVKLDLENIEHLFSLITADPTAPEFKLRGKPSKDQRPEVSIRRAIAATLHRASMRTEAQRPAVRLEGPIQAIPAHMRPPQPPGTTGGRGPVDLSIMEAIAVGCTGVHFFDGPAPQTTFITFNYDTALEQALIKLRVWPDYGLSGNTAVDFRTGAEDDHTEKMAVLKLHGSINWAANRSGGGLTVRNGYGELSADAEVPWLVPPTWRKPGDKNLDSVWAKAVQALSTATRVLILGYSMPPTDQHFRYLLAAGLKANISLRKVVLVNREHEDAYKRIGEFLQLSAGMLDAAEVYRSVRHFAFGGGSTFYGGVRALGLKSGRFKVSGL